MPVKSAKKVTKTGAKKRAPPRRRPPVRRASMDRAALESWISKHDTLLDVAEKYPLTVDEILTDKLNHPSFTPLGGHEGQQPRPQKYDWSVFRAVLESRSSSDARWFVQLRVEDLLLGPDGMDGVSVDCFVICESHEPTLAPAEYTVKLHWPYSDAEDNAPERILPLAGQDMCWRRVVRSDGADINVYMLQKRHETTRAAAAAGQCTPASMFGFGGGDGSAPVAQTAPESPSLRSSSPHPAAAAAACSAFSFGAQTTTTVNPASAFGTAKGSSEPITASHEISGSGSCTTANGSACYGGFNFGFGSTSSPLSAVAASVTPSQMFGFGPESSTVVTRQSATSDINNANSNTDGSNAAANACGEMSFQSVQDRKTHNEQAMAFSFDSTVPTSQPTSSALEHHTTTIMTGTKNDDFTFASGCDGTVAQESAAVAVQPLKTSEVLFALWTRRRLQEMVKEIRSGSRIVRESFPLDRATGSVVKLVMQNDRKDDVAQTVRRFILNRLFAKQDADVLKVDEWTNACPVYDEAVVTAVQKFRERYVHEVAEQSELFQRLRERYAAPIEAELHRIVRIRERAAQIELDSIADITHRIQQRQLAEKTSFRLLKYYASNDIQPFRPFGKISGISEMGETVDVCVPAAHVNVNPFTGKAI